MACSLLTVDRFTQAASLDVLVFLIGTFLVIGFLEESRFFEHVVSAIVGAVGPRPQLLLIVLMILASLASALVGEVTAILFMAGAMLHLTNKYKLNPAPFVIMLVFACNNGSAMSSGGQSDRRAHRAENGIELHGFPERRGAGGAGCRCGDVRDLPLVVRGFLRAFGRRSRQEFAAKSLASRHIRRWRSPAEWRGDEIAELRQLRRIAVSARFIPYGADDPADPRPDGRFVSRG